MYWIVKAQYRSHVPIIPHTPHQISFGLNLHIVIPEAEPPEAHGFDMGKCWSARFSLCRPFGTIGRTFLVLLVLVSGATELWLVRVVVVFVVVVVTVIYRMTVAPTTIEYRVPS